MSKTSDGRHSSSLRRFVSSLKSSNEPAAAEFDNIGRERVDEIGERVVCLIEHATDVEHAGDRPPTRVATAQRRGSASGKRRAAAVEKLGEVMSEAYTV